jgi:hypothetical protein
MTNFDGTGPTLDPGSAEQSRIDPNQGSVGGDAAFDPNHLASILAFIGHEIDHSLAMLRDLAALLSAELCALGQADSVKAVQQGLIASTIALQNEDRIQQRLSDLRSVLTTLEGALADTDSPKGADLALAISHQLRLEETRAAFTYALGLTEERPGPKNTIPAPSIGDVDLF